MSQLEDFDFDDTVEEDEPIEVESQQSINERKLEVRRKIEDIMEARRFRDEFDLD